MPVLPCDYSKAWLRIGLISAITQALLLLGLTLLAAHGFDSAGSASLFAGWSAIPLLLYLDPTESLGLTESHSFLGFALEGLMISCVYVALSFAFGAIVGLVFSGLRRLFHPKASRR